MQPACLPAAATGPCDPRNSRLSWLSEALGSPYVRHVKIPPYWARGSHTGKRGWFRSDTFNAVGWSFNSLAEAKARADEKARRIFEFLRNGQTLDRYEYGERPLCEEIVDRITVDGAEVAIITRNRYGALVLNAANVMFVDVDFEIDAHPATGSTTPPGDEDQAAPVRKAGFWESIRLAFSNRERAERREELAEARLTRIQQWFASHPERAGHVYRTAKGFRVAITDRTFKPASEETKHIFKAMKADPLYQRLTERQECYRARLTPKPWRLEVGKPSTCVWPREHPADQRRFQDWLEAYEDESRRHEVCHLVESIGSKTLSKEVAAVMRVHDEKTMNPTDRRPLA